MQKKRDFRLNNRDKVLKTGTVPAKTGRMVSQCIWRVPGVTGTLGKANSHFDPTQMELGSHHHFEAEQLFHKLVLL